jgi:hypothetical protein
VLREALHMGMTIKVYDRFGCIDIVSVNHPRLKGLGQ